MKDQCIALVNHIKAIFQSKRRAMGPFRRHKPFVEAIEQDEATLSQTQEDIEAIEITEPTRLHAQLLAKIIDHLVPILRSWHQRFKKIKEVHQLDNHNHQEAALGFRKNLTDMFDLIRTLNDVDGTQLITVDAAKDTTESAKSIIRQYEADRIGFTQRYCQEEANNDGAPILEKNYRFI